jgi:hypothetical protein
LLLPYDRWINETGKRAPVKLSTETSTCWRPP